MSADDKTYEVQKTDQEWRAELDPMQYRVARQAATEAPFTGKYWDHFERGRYDCVGCGTPLFASDTKFDAGCGWRHAWPGTKWRDHQTTAFDAHSECEPR